MLERVTVVGTGLIGASLGHALRRARFAGEVVGVDADGTAARAALDLGHVDLVLPLEEAVARSDLVILAVPVGATAAVLALLRDVLGEHAVVTDTGSTKGDVIAAARRVLGERVACFVPGHPIAGGERHGASAADGRLFQGRKVVLTPLAETDGGALERVRLAWRAAGAEVIELDAGCHDRVLAAVSHLPHLLAYALVGHVEAHAEATLAWQLAAGGFRDFTRIAASSPPMWRDIALANRAILLDELDAYGARLQRLRELVEAEDAQGLEALFEGASRARRAWPAP